MNHDANKGISRAARNAFEEIRWSGWPGARPRDISGFGRLAVREAHIEALALDLEYSRIEGVDHTATLMREVTLHDEALARASDLLGRTVTDPSEAYEALEIPPRKGAELMTIHDEALARASVLLGLPTNDLVVDRLAAWANEVRIAHAHSDALVIDRGRNIADAEAEVAFTAACARNMNLLADAAHDRATEARSRADDADARVAEAGVRLDALRSAALERQQRS